MTDIPEKEKHTLVEAYKAFYNKLIMECEEGTLTLEEAKAVGQKVVDGLIEKAFSNSSADEKEREEFKKQFQETIKQECPDMVLDSKLEFTDEGFKRKKE